MDHRAKFINCLIAPPPHGTCSLSPKLGASSNSKIDYTIHPCINAPFFP